MKDGKLLSQIAKSFIPEYYDRIDWVDIWSRKLQSGTAFEWVVFCAMLSVAKESGVGVNVPLLDYYSAGDFFLLRNEIPFSHGALAGNSASLMSAKALKDRFFYCLVPKAVLSVNGKTYSVFREGCPIHKIMSGNNYIDRTDIIIIPGKPATGSPGINKSNTEISYDYEYGEETLSCILRIKNSPYIPCKARRPLEGTIIIPSGIVECSVNKSEEVASTQLQKYTKLFFSTAERTCFSLITGNDLSALPYDQHTIDLNSNDVDLLRDSLYDAAKDFLKLFSIIV